MKICVVGGGSTYTPELVQGLGEWATQSQPIELVLQDIDPARLEIVSGFCKRLVRANDYPVEVTATVDLDSALERAAFILIQIRVGGQKERHNDIIMGLEHGVIGQETVGVGGFAKALRTIPVVLEICKKVVKTNPSAWIINFTNPSGMVTEAVCRFVTTRCVGLCNVPKGVQMDLAQYLKVSESEVELDWVGLNHLGWARRIKVQGKDVLRVLIDALEKGLGPANIPEVSYPPGFLKSLSMLPSPYLRYYYLPDEMYRVLKTSKKTRAQEVAEIEEQLLKYYSCANNVVKPELLEKRGGAWYSRIAVDVINALLQTEPTEIIINTLNLDSLEQFPADASVEVNALLSSSGIKPVRKGELEESIAGLMRQVKSYERLAIEAAVFKDRDKAFLALVQNPLVGSVNVANKILKAIEQRGLLG